jgi:CRISPR-associated protein Csd1
MALDEKINDRSYLFGRLLAVADRVEEQAMYSKDKSNSRMSTAKRYMDAFSKRPYKIWLTIEQGLKPYFAALKPGSEKFYRNTINQIMDSFEIKDFTSLKPLEPLYLLGYHSQLQAFINTKSENNEKEVEEIDNKAY